MFGKQFVYCSNCGTKQYISHMFHGKIEKLEAQLREVEEVARELLKDAISAEYLLRPHSASLRLQNSIARATALLGPEKSAEGKG